MFAQTNNMKCANQYNSETVFDLEKFAIFSCNRWQFHSDVELSILHLQQGQSSYAFSRIYFTFSSCFYSAETSCNCILDESRRGLIDSLWSLIQSIQPICLSTREKLRLDQSLDFIARNEKWICINF